MAEQQDDEPRDRVVEVDDRRRVSLGRIGRHTRYLATELPDGTLILKPAVLMTVEDLVGIVGEAEAAAIAERERDRATGMPWAGAEESPPRR